jgi:DNA (cytosine-5)-methyltransferase 1
MGFPDRLKIVVSDTQAYRQFGNAVVPPVATAVAQQIVEIMRRNQRWSVQRPQIRRSDPARTQDS